MRLLINLLGWTPLCLTSGMSVFVLLLLLAFCVLMSYAISDGVTSFSRILIFLFLFLGVSPISMGLGLLGWWLELAILPVLLICYVDMLHNISSTQFVFRSVYKSKAGSYLLRDGSKLSYSRARALFIQKFRAIGLNTNLYGLHRRSLYRCQQCIPVRVIKKRGRWKSDKAKDTYSREDI